MNHLDIALWFKCSLRPDYSHVSTLEDNFFFFFFCLEVRLKYPLSNTHIDIFVEDNVKKNKRFRNKSRFLSASNKESSSSRPVASPEKQKVTESTESPESPVDSTAKSTDEAAQTEADQKNPVLLAEVVNIEHDKFTKTNEVKVM